MTYRVTAGNDNRADAGFVRAEAEARRNKKNGRTEQKE